MTSKAKPAPKRGTAAQKPISAPKATTAGGKSAIARLEADNASLKAQLASAELKVAALERQRDEALNRIAWVIDSINSLAESVR